MCGIVGVIGARPAAPIILDALRRLEYRGYDSAGIATLVNGHIDRRRAEGKLGNLAASLDEPPLTGSIGIGHTRWATHGAPTESNAHPHGTSRVSLVHNGIIENHAELRAELEAEGQEFSTETDTETVAQLVDLNLKQRHGADRGGRRGAAPAGRRLRAGDDLRRPSGTDRRRPARRAAGGRLRRRRDVRRLRRAGAGAADPPHRLSARRRLDGRGPPGCEVLRHGRQPGRARDQADPPDRRRDRQGQFSPLHGEGAARASGGDRRHAAPHGQPRQAAPWRCRISGSTSRRCRESP